MFRSDTASNDDQTRSASHPRNPHKLRLALHRDALNPDGKA